MHIPLPSVFSGDLQLHVSILLGSQLITESTDFSLIDKTMECAEGHCSLVWHQNPEMGSNEVQILCYLSSFFWYLHFIHYLCF